MDEGMINNKTVSMASFLRVVWKVEIMFLPKKGDQNETSALCLIWGRQAGKALLPEGNRTVDEGQVGIGRAGEGCRVPVGAETEILGIRLDTDHEAGARRELVVVADLTAADEAFVGVTPFTGLQG